MNNNLLSQLVVPNSMSWNDAVRRINETAQGVLLVVDDNGCLARTITDGDLRRALLDGLASSTPLSDLPKQGAPFSVSDSASVSEIQALIRDHSISHVPVLNMQGKPIDLVSARDLSQRIWLSSPHLGTEESVFVEEAFRTNWIAPLGPHVDAFEKELAATVGVAHAAALSSGTAAIHLGLLLLGVKPGDTVFCSSLTFVASANPITYCGAKPVFIDSEPTTWNMSPSALNSAFEWAKTQGCLPKAVVIVNLYGQSADMDELVSICEFYGVPILEDAAESLGASYKGRSSGSFGKVAVFSFNGNKIITTSGGGMLVSNDENLVEQARKLSTQAREKAPHYEHLDVGFNYRMSNVLAAIGRGQLKILEERVNQRRSVFESYREGLAEFPEVQWMPEPTDYRSTRWLSCFTLECPKAEQRVAYILHALERHGIECRPVWKPMHLQPLFKGSAYFLHDKDIDVASNLFQKGICLPSGSNLTASEINRVLDYLRYFLCMTA